MEKTHKVEQIELFPCNKVTKSNLLVEAKYRLTAGEQKLIWLVASAIQPHDTCLDTYEFYIKDILALMGLKSRGSYGTIEAIVETLMEKVLTIRDGLTGNWVKYHLVARAGYKNKEGIIFIKIDEDLKPFFLSLKEKNFTSYRLANILDLKSGYSIRIYELLKQYQKIGSRTISVQELREYLGIDPDEYKLYTNFRKACILKAQEELAEKTDISFEFKEIKRGRAIKLIKFIIHHNESRVDFIKRTFNINGLYPTIAQVKKMEEILEKIEDDEIFRIAVRLKAVEHSGYVDDSIALFIAHPEKTIQSIRNKTFYPDEGTPIKKKQSYDEYEIYVPPEDLWDKKTIAQ